VVLVFNEAVFKLRFNIVDNSVKHGDYWPLEEEWFTLSSFSIDEVLCSGAV
jgi:hypothetical protein